MKYNKQRLNLWYCALITVAMALMSIISPVSAQGFVTQLNEVDLSSYKDSWTPSIQGQFSLLGGGTFDPTTGQFTASPEPPITQVSFGIVTNYPFTSSDLQFAVGLDGFTDLIPITNLTVQNSLIDFNGTTNPIYVVQGDLSQSVVSMSGQHDLDIVYQGDAPIGLGFVGNGNAIAELQANFITAPEPSSWTLLLLALIFLVFLRQFARRTV